MKINLTTLGCPKNLVDSEILLGGLRGKGIEMVENPREADTIILNTCGFIQGAKEESIEAILEAVELKRAGRCRNVFVTGCLSQRYQRELAQEIPEVDGFYGNRDMIRILRDLTQRLDLKRELLGDRHLATPKHYAYLKISEGCENPCTFCSIPAIRGNFRSRSIEALVDEAEILASKGVQELILIAQDSTIYGQDLHGKKQLVPLLDGLTQIREFKWIRLLYTYPAHFDDELLEFLSTADKINYVDLPIQHISDRILKLMARKVKRQDIERIVKRLRTDNPKMAIRTTLIVGFPGETEEEYLELSDFLEQVRFERVGLFTYSHEENTPAYHFPNQIPEEVKHLRWAALNDILNQISFERNLGLIGATENVLIDGYDDDLRKSVGRTAWDCPEIDNTVYLDEKLEPGEFYTVKIIGCADYDLSGSLN
ncbi:30S ribosomal protein S12 methylthiotransferase RimO [candidate division KSB1 bacterium]|nr:30S ribosomal protein S12 methylthiotransferase RimO [candidate division KSB1 bacterium]NIR72148.1 30S ribosomal protein S12 methylthiotransferase RimO [candidate division KSB1 bacterium]NIS26613.1 30S ribosomal protein S12 methylthiotransferase RimO [candidate division KSB1 bacterium]NIT73381.1 30S ribosomal protein S12 methylthiotransferase RimO [candidate division KSB1 bacterium]NIU27229.1 30S ribosomal protein S12 methylthiotransferase RimO [candidate division KSB1 bacterium]